MKIASYIQIVACAILLLGLVVFLMFWHMYQQTENIAKQHFEAQISSNNFAHLLVLSRSWLTTQDLFFSGHQSYLANGINEQSKQLVNSVDALNSTLSNQVMRNELSLLKKEIVESNRIVTALSGLSEPNNELWLKNIAVSDEITSKLVVRLDAIHSYYQRNETHLAAELSRINELFKQRILIIGISYLLTVFIIIIWMVREVVRPIESLTNTVTTKNKILKVSEFLKSSAPLEVFGLAEAICEFTEQINLEHQISQRERLNTLSASNRLSLIMNTAPIAIILVDNEGFIRDLNPETENLFALAKIKIKGESLHEFIPSMATLDKEFDRHYVIQQHQETLLSSQLKARYVEFTGKSLTIEEHDYFLVCVTDIDDKKRNEKKLTKLNKQLIHNEKMASIGQLSAGIAHEINNPIGFVNSNISSLEQYLIGINKYIEASKNNEPKPILDNIYQVEDLEFVLGDIPSLIKSSKDGLERVINIVKDLGVYSHNESGNKTRIKINEVIDQSLTLVANELKYKAVVKKELDSDVECLGFPQKLLQVFINLFINASHAINENGEIIVSSQLVDGCVIINVQDNGCGIADEYKTKLFDPFFTTKPVGSGTGLGLHIVHNIVKEHDGEIALKSSLGKGTTISIKLPVDG